MKISFWGVRGSIAAPGPDTVCYGGNTTCLEITGAAGHTIVIDAGTGIRLLGDSLLARGENPHFHLLMTHIHWDHLVGFPFFAPLFQEAGHIVVDGYGRAMEGLKKLFSTDFIDGTWPVRFQDLRARIESGHILPRKHIFLEGMEVESHPIHHPQGGMGFKFKESSGTFIFLTDNELTDDAPKGTCFKDFVVFCRGADLLVHDCQYTSEEMNQRRGWGHTDVQSVAKLALEAGVRRLVLFHHDPWRTDAGVQRMRERCAEVIHEANGGNIEVECASEGMVLEV
jgi:phosphoribosyl 1,2-cyclic phosphodiesterase